MYVLILQIHCVSFQNLQFYNIVVEFSPMCPTDGSNCVFCKVGYSTESRSTGVGRLAMRIQTNYYSKN